MIYQLNFDDHDIAEACVNPIWDKRVEKFIVIVPIGTYAFNEEVCRNCASTMKTYALMDDATEYMYCIDCIVQRLR